MPLKPAHLLLALAVVAVWGTNFAVIGTALHTLPPLLFAALRFLFAFLPAALFLPRPAVPIRNVAAYGLLIGVGQFGLLYIAINGRISAGLASLVVQTQVFFTIALAMWIGRERLRAYQVAAVTLACVGLAIVGLHTDASTTVTGLLLVLAAALSWSGGNIVGKRAGSVHMLAYVVWSSAFAVPVLALLSLLVEGPARITTALVAAGWGTWLAVTWQSWGNTLFGYAAWTWLLSRYPAAVVSPMALLVPVFGLAAASVWLGEPLPGWKLAAGAFVLAGLGLNLLWPSWRGARRQQAK